VDKEQWHELIGRDGYRECDREMTIHFDPEVIIMIEDFIEDHEWAEGGVSHIVLGDYNVEDDDIDLCIRGCEELIGFLKKIKEIPNRVWYT
jgi:hypothetical protein